MSEVRAHQDAEGRLFCKSCGEDRPAAVSPVGQLALGPEESCAGCGVPLGGQLGRWPRYVATTTLALDGRVP